MLKVHYNLLLLFYFFAFSCVDVAVLLEVPSMAYDCVRHLGCGANDYQRNAQ